MEIDRRQFIANSTAGSAVLFAATAISVNSEAHNTTDLEFQPEATSMNQPKVLIIIGDATETVDTLYPYYRLI